MKSKSFKYWKVQELHQSFGIDQVFDMDIMENWLKVENDVTNLELQVLEELRKRASYKIDYWNEEELKMNFIGPLIQLINFDGKKYRAFFDRPISVEIHGIRLFGKIDMFVANGFQEPENPYFCIHEYKQENNRDGDPKGQLLSEMLAVQALNADEKPIYGCYVLARNWYFVVLNKDKYAVSEPYISTQQVYLERIFKMLKFIKSIIELTNKEN
jgi:hypothetical protein